MPQGHFYYLPGYFWEPSFRNDNSHDYCTRWEGRRINQWLHKRENSVKKTGNLRREINVTRWTEQNAVSNYSNSRIYIKYWSASAANIRYEMLTCYIWCDLNSVSLEEIEYKTWITLPDTSDSLSSRPPTHWKSSWPVCPINHLTFSFTTAITDTTQSSWH